MGAREIDFGDPPRPWCLTCDKPVERVGQQHWSEYMDDWANMVECHRQRAFMWARANR